MSKLASDIPSFDWSNIRKVGTEESRHIDIEEVERTNPRLANMWRKLISEPQSAQPAQRMNIRIGNTAAPVSGSSNFEWSVYVQPATTAEDFGDIATAIQSVSFNLHPTFSPSSVTVQAPPFEVQRTGWGTFPILVHVHASDGCTYSFTHNLSFDDSQPNEHTEVFEMGGNAVNSTVAADTRCAGETKSNMAGNGAPVVRMTGVDPVCMHGKFGDPSWAAPIMVTRCHKEARPGYQTMKAHEFNEDPEVLHAKVILLSKMILKSSNLVAYTGAGISTASGIDDYASKSSNSVAMKRKKVKSGFDANPTLAHFALTALYRTGHLKHWVQQNHDGLPQKSGFPQHMLNEIHGAWQDPSNPVVPMSGSLRDDLCDWMCEWEQKADLVLAMGSSLCGMNADRMVATPTEKLAEGVGLGSVIVSLQQTACDEGASLRIFAKIDDVMALLAYEMGLSWSRKLYNPNIPKSACVGSSSKKDMFYVPYDRKGDRIDGISPGDGAAACTVWNLQTGAKVRVTRGPGKGYEGVIVGKRSDGHYRVRLPCQREGSVHQGKTPTIYILGTWWVEAATKGLVPTLPIVNANRQAV